MGDYLLLSQVMQVLPKVSQVEENQTKNKL
jgi:hypothetical protein